MYCTNCGKKVLDHVDYCHDCGAFIQRPVNQKIDYKSTPIAFILNEISFSGRRGRVDFFSACLVFFWLFVYPVRHGWDNGSEVMTYISLVIMAIAYYMLCVNLCRRLHDINRRGEYAFIILIPFTIGQFQYHSAPIIKPCFYLSIALALALASLKGTDGLNRYGTPPC